MIGETWNHLAAPPSAREVDAALAEVRVRAMVHERRHVGRIRASIAAGFAAMALIGGYAGWNGAAYRAAQEAGSDGESSAVAWPSGSASAAVGPAAEIPAEGMLPAIRRYRIRAWSEFEGRQVAAGDAFIESPDRVYATLRVQFVGADLDWRVAIDTTAGQALRYAGWATLRRHLGASSRGLPRYEEGLVALQDRVPFGRQALFTLLRGVPHTSELHIRIDGPNATLPGRPLHWLEGEHGARYANAAGWMVADVATRVDH